MNIDYSTHETSWIWTTLCWISHHKIWISTIQRMKPHEYEQHYSEYHIIKFEYLLLGANSTHQYQWHHSEYHIIKFEYLLLRAWNVHPTWISKKFIWISHQTIWISSANSTNNTSNTPKRPTWISMPLQWISYHKIQKP